ncbi:hypothetical protein D3C72_905770 [compost metagenome]
MPPFRFKAPVIPVSSSIVNKASIAGCGISLLSRIAIIVATPSPLSAPSVVPRARTQSPSTYISIPCVSKSKTVSAFFWCTISKCPCITIGLRFSIPGVAGFLMITFLISSSKVSRPKLFPKFFINSITRSSFFDGRGTAFKSANLFQSAFGSRFLIS